MLKSDDGQYSELPDTIRPGVSSGSIRKNTYFSKPDFKALVSRINLLIRKIGEYRSRLPSHTNNRSTRQVSPFVKNRDGGGISVPLLQTFRFVHEPIGSSSAARFIGRQSEMESLAERILFSEGGSFLVTGYRGVGKTSYVNQVIKKLEEALPWAQPLIGKSELVNVYLNVARPVQPSEIMHHIIRQLHDRLVEKGIYQLLDRNLQDALTLAYHRTSVNMARKLAESSERSFGFTEASIGADWMKAAVKMSMNSKRSQTQNYEISYLGYDDKAAEHDLIHICRRLVNGYLKPLTTGTRLKNILTGQQADRIHLKIIFVFDELDKLEECTELTSANQKPVIDQILGALKNLFTTSGVTFVFVAGKDLQERWLDDVGKGDSVYESVFSYDRYLPCLWADVDAICDQLVDIPTYQSRQVYDEFKQFLAFKGRGIPRRIIRTFNEYVEWNDNRPVLTFSPLSLRRIRFFAGLQSVLKAHEKALFGNSHEEILGTQSDKRRLGVYYLIDWILRQGTSEFTRNHVLTASKRLSAKIALAEEIAPSVADDILQILLDNDYIQEIGNTLNRVLMGGPDDPAAVVEKRYKLTPRRLVEFGGVEIETDPTFVLPKDSIDPYRSSEVSQIGKYKVVRSVGQGGMGVVYEAVDANNGRRVAIKTITDNVVHDEIRARFEREAMIMSELDHPNIVRFYEWDKDNERVYIVMEFLDGPTLETVIRTHGKLSLELALAIFRPILSATDYMHRKGFVRHDIKPSNIKITSAGRVCILDFGITRPTSANPRILSKFETMAGGIFGTPMFMAPEQLKEEHADERSDIYSLGIVLYNMLTGKFPFRNASSIRELVDIQINELPIPPSRYAALPASVEELILKCLERDPNERFQTAKGLFNALNEMTVIHDVLQVDLKLAVAELGQKVRDVAAMDQMVTAVPASPVDFPVSTEVRPRRLSRQPDSLSRMDSGVGPEAEGLSDTVRLIERRDYVPEVQTIISRITLLVGTKEEIDFNLSASESGFRLENKTTFGRSSENLIVIRDDKISRYHGQFYVEGEHWFVEDFNSNRGTYVNGARILARRILRTGDQIGIGDFLFGFEH